MVRASGANDRPCMKPRRNPMPRSLFGTRNVLMSSGSPRNTGKGYREFVGGSLFREPAIGRKARASIHGDRDHEGYRLGEGGDVAQ